MNDRELAILEVTIWALLIYCLVLAIVAATRLFIRNGDVVAEAEEIRLAAESVLTDADSIDSFVTDWMPVTRKVAIAEAIVLDRQRDHR